MIAEHISEELGSVKAKKFRLRLKEISKKELLESLKQPGNIDISLVNSQVCRRLIDRIFGFEISPVLWKVLKISGLSAGRVQSAVLKWLCEREIEIRNFNPEEYVSLKAIINTKDGEWELNYLLEEEEGRLNKEKSNQLLELFKVNPDGSLKKEVPFQSIEMGTKKFTNNAPRAFTTASLQETAAKVLNLNPTQTMRIAQALYEGKKVNGEIFGLITYMRTDSTRVSDAKKKLATQYLRENFPKLEIINQTANKSKLHAQDAHEAIVPTDPRLIPERIKQFLTKDESAIYNLIWQRLMTSLLAPEKGIDHSFIFESKGEKWKRIQREVVSNGYKDFYNSDKLLEKKQVKIKIGDVFPCQKFLVENKVTSPKERYTPGQIIAKMEKTGIGRPSTYSQTLETLKKRKYILEVKSRLGVSRLGENVNGFLINNFSELIGETFTKNMESSLDDLANGIGDKIQLIDSFYKTVLKLKKGKYSTEPTKAESIKSKDAKAQTFVTEKKESIQKSICPICGSGEVRSKFSKNGKTIYFCSRYPQCDFVSYEPNKN